MSDPVQGAERLVELYASGRRDFVGANLRRANLHRANLRGADLRKSNLRGANLFEADLGEANLREVDLREANLRWANLIETNLCTANLSGAEFAGATLANTLLCDLNLGAFCRSQISHRKASIVDYRSILRSLGEPNLAQFLRDLGMPEVFVQYNIDCAKSMNPNILFSLLQSTFISYGEPDEAFARQLSTALRREGVKTFFFRDDAVPGEELHTTMRSGVREHDRVILVCSEASLVRRGLLTELNETLRREAEDAKSYLIPVVLDNFLFDGWAPADQTLKSAVTSRVAADFRGLSDASLKAGIVKLVKALKKP